MEFEVAVPVPLPQTFSYAGEGPIAVGSRVSVPFGARKLVGVVLGESVRTDTARGFAIKPIASVIDAAPVYSPIMLKLAKWLAHYYMHPIGEVLRTMLPASATKLTKEQITISEKAQALLAEKALHTDLEDTSIKLLRLLFGKKPTLSKIVAKKKIADFLAATPTAVGEKLSLADLKKQGFITLQRGSLVTARRSSGGSEVLDLRGRAEIVANAVMKQMPLTAGQQHAFATISAALEGKDPARKPFLLHGVTGSGKTEVYLQLIAATIAAAADTDLGQTLVLVPEISLTPQMTGVFSERFPGLVAVVHSAMTDTERWAELERIRNHQALILIGPRSSVFGPFANLRLVIVDEEHDQSYKQATGLTYNGRDVAIVRAKWEQATVVLGSATPSLESFHNAQTGKYQLLQMLTRVNARALPEVTLIKTKPPQSAGMGLTTRSLASDEHATASDVPIAEEIMAALERNLQSGHQAMVIVNRRGFAYYLFSLTTKRAVTCPQCTISLTMHRKSQLLRCHYCDYAVATTEILQKNPNDQFVAVGYGSEKVEGFLQKRFPAARIERLDSDMVAKRELLPAILNRFKRGEIDILVGTQMLAKGHDFPNVTLMVLLDVDRALDLPDFRAGERAFQLIVQAAGRAGRGTLAGKVFMQLARPEHAIIQTALRQDYHEFAAAELQFRRDLRYPPFARVIAFEFSDTDQRNLSTFTRRLEEWVERMLQTKPTLAQQLRILGPSVPAIETIRHRHRRTLLIFASDIDALHQFGGALLATFQKLPGDLRLRVDVDPQSLM